MTYTELEEYFIAIALEDPEIKSTEIVEDWSDIMAMQMSRELYPCLVIEIHQVKGDTESAAVEYIVQGAYAVITGLPTDASKAERRKALRDNLAAITRIHQRITCDADAEGIFGADLKIQFDPIKKATADNAYGQRGYYSISEITKD